MNELSEMNDIDLYDSLLSFLSSKKVSKSIANKEIKSLIDSNKRVWDIWNKVRWDAAKNTKGVSELKEFFGNNFIEYYDSSWALSNEWHTKDRSTSAAVEDFYASTSNYVYNSVIFYESGDRPDLSSQMAAIVEGFNITTVNDYGCGVGNDGINFIEKFNAKVNFTDFNSTSLAFLKWRLNKRGISQSDYEINTIESKARTEAQLLWAVDVLEHMLNPLQVLDFVTDKTKAIAFFVDDDDAAGGRHPFHFPVSYTELENSFKKLNFKRKLIEGMTVWYK